MDKLKELSVFFPAFNEEENIQRLVSKALDVFPRYAEKFEILIINDGSTDKTKEISEALCEAHDNIRLISHAKNRGYGASLKSGFRESKYKFVFFTDGDLQFDLEEIKKFIPLISSCDIAAGYRIKRNDPPHRVINGKAYNLLVRLLFGLKVRDIDCAFKIIKKEVLDNVQLKSESQFISAELLIKAKKTGYIIKQAGAHHFPREKGEATGNNIRVVINSFTELFKLWKELR